MARRRLPSSRQIGMASFLCLLIVWLSVLVVGIYHKEQLARLTVADTRSQLAALDVRTNELSSTVHTLGTSRGQEESLRETYGVAKPGEDVIIVVPKRPTPPPPPSSFWEKVKAFLGI